MNDQLLFAICSLLIGLSKGGLGGPVPVSLVVPLLSTFMPVADSVAIVLPLLIFADLFALKIYWKKWDAHYIRLMLPAGLIGIVMGATLLSALAGSDNILRFLLGVLTLIAIVYKYGSSYLAQIEYTPRNWHGYLAGWLTGVGSSVANTGSPQYTVYMLLQRVTPIVFVGTATLFFAVLNLSKVPAFLALGLLDVDALLSILWVLPIVPFGVWLGRRLLDLIDPVTFERLLIGLLTIVALHLIISSLM